MLLRADVEQKPYRAVRPTNTNVVQTRRSRTITDPMLNIRSAVESDAATIVELICDLGEYEREPEKVRVTAEDIRKYGFGPNPRFGCFIAEWDGRPVGFALYYFTFSTWEGRPSLYLEDLFVHPPFRGRGIGKELMIRLAQHAAANECTRFEWVVLDWNRSAMNFYESIGAFKLDDWFIYRMESEAIKRLATS